MTVVAGLFMMLGGAVAALGGFGLIRKDFDTVYIRMHVAGKASPIGYLVAAVGAVMQLDFGGLAYVIIAGVAMVMTLPVGVHLLFRAAYRTESRDHFVADELAD